MNEKLLLMSEQKKWFLEIESTPGKNTVKIIEMTAQGLEYTLNLLDKATAGFEEAERNSM